MRVSILVPCFNEEKAVSATVASCLNQSRPFDEVIFVDDCSTDKTAEKLAEFGDKITVICTPKNSGNKSSAQEYGLQFVTGDVFVTTDGDTILHPHFCEEIIKSYNQNPGVAAVVGYVKSLPYNWLTLCRAFEYAIGQNIHKRAQGYLKYIFVMPGAASSFRTDIFRHYIKFDHDTITEDLDFTYKLHQNNCSIIFNTNAICYTQDPSTIYNYTNQMRRWFGGGWQNLLKHFGIITTKHARAFELSLGYAEGLLFSLLLFILPVLNVIVWLKTIAFYLLMIGILAIYAAYKEKRWQLVLAPIPYLFLMHINAFVYLEQFVKEVILQKKHLTWFKPERFDVDVNVS